MKKLYAFRALYWILFAFFTIGVPCLLIVQKYDLTIRIETKKQVAGAVTMIVIIIAFFFRGQIKQMIKDLGENAFTNVVDHYRLVILLLSLFFVLKVAEIHIASVIYIVSGSAASNLIAGPMYAVHRHYRQRIIDIKEAKKAGR